MTKNKIKFKNLKKQKHFTYIYCQNCDLVTQGGLARLFLNHASPVSHDETFLKHDICKLHLASYSKHDKQTKLIIILSKMFHN